MSSTRGRSVRRPAPEPPHRYDSHPAGLRRAKPWHRLAYIIEKLPEGLAELAGALHAAPGDRVLDLGCADTPYRHLLPAGVEYLAADLPGNEHANVTIAPDGTVPVADGSVDVVLSTQVLEHVADPGAYLAECRRVLRPGGRMLLSTHGFMIWHPDPIDRWRWTGEGLRHAVEAAGFDIVRFEGIMGLAATGVQFFQDGLHHRLPAPLRPAFCLVLQTLARLVDRFDSRENRRLNALVFALVAEKP